MTTQRVYHPSVLTGRVTATPILAKVRPDKPPRTTFIVRGRHSRRRVRIHAAEQVAADVCASLRPGDLVTFSGIMVERTQDGKLFRFLELESFMIHPKDAA